MITVLSKHFKVDHGTKQILKYLCLRYYQFSRIRINNFQAKLQLHADRKSIIKVGDLNYLNDTN